MHRSFYFAQSVILAGLLIGLLAACAPSAKGTTTVAPTSGQGATPNASGGIPNQLTDLELMAGQLGEASYSGYACVTTPLACACDSPLIQKAKFVFTPDNRLAYDFAPVGGASSEWLLDHAGVNQWSYASPLRDKSGNTQAVAMFLLSFTQDGYVLTQVTNMSTGEVVSCPDVNFRRLVGVTPTP